MGPVFYVMAILGCGEADAACQQVDVARAQYQSVEACQVASETEIAERSELLFPVVVAQCRRADSPVSLVTADQVDLPGSEPLPAAKDRFEKVQMAKLDRR